MGHADGVGAAATFSYPEGMEVDAGGNLYVADNSSEIRKITPTGIVTTFAGSLTPGSADGQGAAAQFSSPTGLAVDAAGNLFVADFGNWEIRKITPAASVTTFAGSPFPGIADGTGAAASFKGPGDVAIDASGTLLVIDGSRVRKITPEGVVTTLAGSIMSGAADGTGTAATFNGLSAIAVDDAGNAYVADYGNNEIRKITPAGVVTTLAGSTTAGFANGTGSAAQFNAPTGIAVDHSGNVYVADFFNNQVRKIAPGGVVSTLAGSAAAGSADGVGAAARFSGPTGLALDKASGHLFVSDFYNHEIRMIVVGP